MASYQMRALKLLAVLGLLNWGAAAQAADRPDFTKEEKEAMKIPLKVRVSAPRTLYKGLPCLVHLNIENSRPWLVDPMSKDPSKTLSDKESKVQCYTMFCSRLPLTDLLAPPPISTTIVNPREDRVIQTTRAPLRAYSIRHPAVFERAVETTKTSMVYEKRVDFVVDLAPQLIELAPGEYTLKVRLHQNEDDDPNWVWDAKPITFRLERLPDKVRQVIRAANPELPKNPAKFWRGAWVDEKIDIAALEAKLPAELFSSLALHAFLSSAQQRGIAKARLELLDKVPADLKPVADCLRYEVLLAQKKTDAAKCLRAKIAKEHPGLKWRLEYIDRGEGTIAGVGAK